MPVNHKNFSPDRLSYSLLPVLIFVVLNCASKITLTAKNATVPMMTAAGGYKPKPIDLKAVSRTLSKEPATLTVNQIAPGLSTDGKDIVISSSNYIASSRMLESAQEFSLDAGAFYCLMFPLNFQPTHSGKLDAISASTRVVPVPQEIRLAVYYFNLGVMGMYGHDVKFNKETTIIEAVRK